MLGLAPTLVAYRLGQQLSLRLNWGPPLKAMFVTEWNNHLRMTWMQVVS